MIIVATHYDSFIWALLAHKAKVKSIYLHDMWCNASTGSIPPYYRHYPDKFCLSKLAESVDMADVLSSRIHN